jgi:cold shock CspA family protein
MRVQGSVIQFDVSRGFGFVLPDGARKPAFIHVKNVEGELLLRKDDRLEFELITTKRGLMALKAVLLSEGVSRE